MDNSFRQELRSPRTGQVHVVGNPADAARLRSQGYALVGGDEKPAEPDPGKGSGDPHVALDASTESKPDTGGGKPARGSRTAAT